MLITNFRVLFEIIIYSYFIVEDHYSYSLTLHVPIPDGEKKLTEVFIFTLPDGASKGFMMTLKAFIKPFEAPQRSVKIKS